MAVIYSSKGTPILIDDEDWNTLMLYNWSEVRTPQGRLYFQTSVQGTSVYLHRMLMGATSWEWVDHADGDYLNCRKENLRKCTPRQNNQNLRIKKNSKTGFKGVQRRHDGKFIARIRDQTGRRLFLGSFPTPEEAHSAYVAASEVHHGEFARAA
jgi:hypothetical protein